MTGTTTADRPTLGLVLMLGFCLVIPVSDALGKLLAECGVPILQIVFARFAIQSLALVPLALSLRQSFRFTPLGWALTAIRTVLQASAIYAFVTALTYLPLADALAIAFVMPFIMLLLGHWVLGETVGRARLMACAVGFVGVLMVIQPAFAEVGWPVLLPLLVALLYALFMLVTRRLSREAEAIPMQAASGVMATVGVGLILLLTGQTDLPSGPEAANLSWMLLATGVLGTCAHLMMTASLRFAPSTMLAPLQYLEIPVATLVGFAVWGDLPNGLAAVGICVTIATGLYILWRERTEELRGLAA